MRSSSANEKNYQPLAVVGIRVTSVISSISVIETRVGIRVASITISQPGVSLSLGLGLSLSRPGNKSSDYINFFMIYE